MPMKTFVVVGCACGCPYLVDLYKAVQTACTILHRLGGSTARWRPAEKKRVEGASRWSAMSRLSALCAVPTKRAAATHSRIIASTSASKRSSQPTSRSHHVTSLFRVSVCTTVGSSPRSAKYAADAQAVGCAEVGCDAARR